MISYRQYAGLLRGPIYRVYRRAAVFCIPIAAALFLTDGSYQLALSQDDMVKSYCDLDRTHLSGLRADGGYYDTSWLPGRDAFVLLHGGHFSPMWNSVGKVWFTPAQLELLKVAYRIGYEGGGPALAQLVQAVLLQESMAGYLDRIGRFNVDEGKRSYGVMQIKVAAARDVLRMHTGLGEFDTDDQLIARLIRDDVFNIRIASIYLSDLRRSSADDYQALVAYNIGPNAAKQIEDASQFDYVQKIQEYLAGVVVPFDNKYSKLHGA